ncbi:MAG: hypothetical protein WBR24_23650 [Desulfobacterales bacterium]
MTRKEKQTAPVEHSEKRAMPSVNPLPFVLFPKWRMYREFPWPIWAAGWLAVFKALLWLATDPVAPIPIAERMAAKFLIMMIPFLVTGIGVWNLRKWAVWGLMVTSVLDLLFFVVFPDAARIIAGKSFIGLAVVLLAGVGPLGDVLILAATPSMLKHAGKFEHLRPLLTSKG